jgi:PAS domain S-box-containing protein
LRQQGVLVFCDSKPVFANQAMADILGHDGPDDFLRMDSIEEFVHADEIERTRAMREARLRGEPVPKIVEHRAIRKDGSTLWLEVRPTVVEWDGERAMQAAFFDITERKKAEHALRESEERLNAFFTHAPAGLVLYDAECRYTKINRTLAEVNGLAIEAHLGRRPSDCLSPDFAAMIERDVREVLETGVALENVELSAKHPSRPGVRGSWVVSRFPVPMAGGESAAVGSVVVDITRQKQAEEALRQARDELELKVVERTRELAKEKERFQRYIALANTLFVAVDREGTITLVNRKASEVLGYGEDELIGRNWFDLMVPEEEREQRRAYHEGLLANDGKAWSKGARRENYVLTKRGERRLLSWRNSLVRDDDGRIVVTLGAAEDITGQRRTEIELRQTHRSAALGTLAGGISDSLNKLLLPVGTLTEMVMLDLPENSPDRESLAKVLEASHRAAEMVKRILAFGRRDEPRRVHCDIYRVVTETLALVRPSVPSTITLEERLEARTGTVFADPAQAETVLMNLVTNAAAAIGGRTGRISVALAPVVLDAAAVPGLEPGRYARITVADDGPGLDRETLERIFDPFLVTKGAGEGPGLGLSITHGIVTQHGGAMHAESGPGGSRFEVYLPLADAATVH